jgi:hypothetical protein
VLVEVGNAAKGLFVFDLGSGALIAFHRRGARRVYWRWRFVVWRG